MPLPRSSYPTVSVHSHLPVVGDLRQLPLRRRPTASSTPSLPSRIVSTLHIDPRAGRSRAFARHAPASSCQVMSNQVEDRALVLVIIGCDELMILYGSASKAALAISGHFQGTISSSSGPR